MENPKLDEVVIDSYMTASKHDTYPYIDPLQANLSNKAVFISGASKGIGKATAIAYAKAGASHIALAARSDLTSIKAEVLKAASAAHRPEPTVLTIKFDTTRIDDCSNAVDQVEQAFGHLDILINNAGYLEKWKPIADSDPDEWWKTFEVNVKGVYLVCRAFIPLLLKGGDKTIITVASAGAIARTPSASAYQTSKQTNLRFTDYLNVEYNDQGLLAYCIHPGGVKTELAYGMPEWMHGVLNEEPELPADTIVWLTKEKRPFLAGRYVSVMWDMEELLAKKDEIEQKNLLRFRLRQ